MTLPSSEPPDDTWTIPSKSSQSTNEAITTTRSVIHPGQENEIWNSLHQDSLLVENQSLEDSSKRKYFYKNSIIIKVLVKAHDEVESW